MPERPAAGYNAIIVTVDAPVLGRRLNEYRNSFEPPEGTSFPNLSSDPSFSFVDASREGLINGEDPNAHPLTPSPPHPRGADHPALRRVTLEV